MSKHNDAEDPYHLRLFDFVVLGSQVIAEHDLVRIRGLGQLVEFVPKRFAGITIIGDYRHCLVSRGRLRDARRYN